ncbi:MAG: YHYH protein [Bacteroidota bacterium]|nr:YHYH protein [Bacteroidota bacterium]
MKKIIPTLAIIASSVAAISQTNPAITSWLQNTTVKGRHYVSGNSTPITDATLTANTQSVQYSATNVYVTTQGVPSYITGPFLDGNPSLTSNQNAIFKFPLNPVQNTGSLTPTSGGNIGVFINGVAMFDYRDGVSWKNSTGAMAGGPLGGTGDGVWNRDAIVAEKGGFDCAKGHPAMGNYHHHQNPSAFDLDLSVISNVCSLYDADGLYVIDSTVHSPLIGFAYDGFPVYGAYGYKNANGTGGIVRMKSSWSLRNITTRTTLYTGATVTAGPNVNTTYPLGTFKEDYGYTAPTSSDYLDEHNGRFCVTPEYPAGIYCYFATVNSSWNSAYPYLVGPTYYGTKVAAKVTSITETVNTYTTTVGIAKNQSLDVKATVFPNPTNDIIVVQIKDLVKENYNVTLCDITGKLVDKTILYQGSTVVFFDTKTLYSGEYFVTLTSESGNKISKKVTIVK